MWEVFVELVDNGVVVYRPGTAEVVITAPTIEQALAFARAEWPDLGIRVVISGDRKGLLWEMPARCAHCG